MVRNCEAPEPEPDPEAFAGLTEADFDEYDHEANVEVREINAETVAGICGHCGSAQDVEEGLCGYCAGTADIGGEA